MAPSTWPSLGPICSGRSSTSVCLLRGIPVNCRTCGSQVDPGQVCATCGTRAAAQPAGTAPPAGTVPQAGPVPPAGTAPPAGTGPQAGTAPQGSSSWGLGADAPQSAPPGAGPWAGHSAPPTYQPPGQTAPSAPAHNPSASQAYGPPQPGYGPPAQGYSAPQQGYSWPQQGYWAHQAPGDQAYPPPGAGPIPGMPMPAYAREVPQIPTPSNLSFGQAIGEVFSKYGVFRGRATRSEYWWWQLFSFLVFWLPAVGAVVISIVAGAMESASGADVDGWYALGGLLMVLGAITGLALLVPNLAVAVRRLHDMDLSGWV